MARVSQAIVRPRTSEKRSTRVSARMQRDTGGLHAPPQVKCGAATERREPRSPQSRKFSGTDTLVYGTKTTRDGDTAPVIHSDAVTSRLVACLAALFAPEHRREQHQHAEDLQPSKIMAVVQIQVCTSVND